MNENQGFKGLSAWQKAMDLVESIYRSTRSWPEDERFGLINQVRRAAVSVPSNIAEGQGKSSQGDFGRFLSIALGSLAEIETQLLIASRLGYLSESEAASLVNKCKEVARITQGLSTFIRQKLQTQR